MIPADPWAVETIPRRDRRAGVRGVLGVVVVLGLPFRLLVRRTDRHRGWRNLSSSPADLTRRQFRRSARSRASGARRLGWSLAAMALLLATAVVVERRLDGTAATAKSASRTSGQDDAAAPTGIVGNGSSAERRYSAGPAGNGQDWVDELQREKDALPLPPGPVASYSVGDYTSTYMNVRGGERSTSAPPACSCRPLRVWLAGGSAAFGIGQRDDHTIASELVRLGGLDGRSLDVHNIAVPGHTRWQEYQIVLAKLLAEPGSPPDLIVFYDGFNDVVVSLASTLIDGPSWDRPAVYDASRPFGVPEGIDIPAAVRKAGGVDDLGRHIARRFEDLRRLMTAQLDQLSIASAYFFQPDATASRLQSDAGVQPGGVVGPELLGSFRRTADVVASNLDSADHDLRDVFEGVPRPVFYDIVHTNEDGAAVVAETLYRQLAPTLDSLAAARR